MPAEIALFLAFFASACVAILVLLYRSNSRTAPRLLLWSLLLGVPAITAFLFLKSRYPREVSLETGMVLVAVPYVVGFFLVDRLSRRREGLVFEAVDLCVFREKGASGRSCDSPFSAIGRANRCLTVTVTEDELWVDPVFPCSPVARVWGLVHRVPLLRIHQMERLAGNGANIRLEYTGEDGWCRCIELKLRNPSAFIDAVREGQWEGVR